MCGHHPCDKPNCTHGEAHRAACEARTVIRASSLAVMARFVAANAQELRS